jgi:hypothetical protein
MLRIAACLPQCLQHTLLRSHPCLPLTLCVFLRRKGDFVLDMSCGKGALLFVFAQCYSLKASGLFFIFWHEVATVSLSSLQPNILGAFSGGDFRKFQISAVRYVVAAGMLPKSLSAYIPPPASIGLSYFCLSQTWPRSLLPMPSIGTLHLFLSHTNRFCASSQLQLHGCRPPPSGLFLAAAHCSRLLAGRKGARFSFYSLLDSFACSQNSCRVRRCGYSLAQALSMQTRLSPLFPAGVAFHLCTCQVYSF